MCRTLEDKADALINASLEGVTNREDKSDVMTAWKLKHRKIHEILTRTGAPVDSSVRRGQFSKAWNSAKPNLNSYDGPTCPPKINSSWNTEGGSDGSDGMSNGPLSHQMSLVIGVERIDD